MSQDKRPVQPDGTSDAQTHDAGNGQRDQQPILTTRQGHPVHNNQALRTVGPRGPATLENYHFLEKIGALRPRAHPRARRARARLRRLRHFEAYGTIGDEPASTYTRAKLFQDQGQDDPGRGPLLDRHRRPRLVGGGARPAGVRGQVQDRGRQLGSGRQQPAGLLHPRRDQVPRRDPLAQAGPGDVPPGAQSDLRLHEQHARVDAHADVALQPARHPARTTAPWTALASTPIAWSTRRATASW